MRVVFLDASTVSHQGDVSLEGLQPLGEWTSYETTAASETAARVREADIVLTNKVVLDRAILEGAPQIKLIAVTATGTNNVDLEVAKALGIQVCNVSGYSTHSVAQHTFTLILNLITSMPQFLVEKRAWAASPIFTRLDHPVRDLAGMTLGIAGAGNIGRRVGELGEAFGMTVQCLQRNANTASSGDWPRIPKQTFFETSDVVSLHCPLTPGTHHLINAESLRWMKPSAYLINTGRGELVEETSLIEALREGRLAGAGLDVLATEPPPADHPLLTFEHPKLFITPHSAWSSLASRRTLIALVESNIRAFLDSGEVGNRLV